MMRVMLYREDKSIDKVIELDCMKVHDTDKMLDKLREEHDKFEPNVYHNMSVIKAVSMIELYISESDLMTKTTKDLDSAWKSRKIVETTGYFDTHLKPEVVQLYFKTNSDFNHAIKEIEALGTIKTNVCALVICKYNTELESGFGSGLINSIY